jgi:hypothetical protein
MTAPAVVTDIYRDDAFIALGYIRVVEETAFVHAVGTHTHARAIEACDVARRYVNIFASNCALLAPMVPAYELYGHAVEHTEAQIAAEHPDDRCTRTAVRVARKGLERAEKVSSDSQLVRQKYSFEKENRKLR